MRLVTPTTAQVFLLAWRERRRSSHSRTVQETLALPFEEVLIERLPVGLTIESVALSITSHHTFTPLFNRLLL